MSELQTLVFDAHIPRDPTQTTMLRKAFRSAAKLQLRQLRAAMRVALMDHNVLGFGSAQGAQPASTRLIAFSSWLDSSGRQYLLGPDWARSYIQRAWRMGARRAAQETAAPIGEDHSDRIVALADIEIEGILGVTVQQVSRTAAQIIARGTRRYQALRQLYRTFDKIAQPRLVVMADVLAIKAYNEAKLHTYKEAGVTHVGVQAEHLPHTRMDAADRKTDPYAGVIGEEEQLVGILTAGDNKVCELCQDWADDAPYEIDEVLDVYPLHPRCRCNVFPWEDLRYRGDDSFEDYDPNEPRVAKGQTGGGQWTSGAAGELWSGSEHGETVSPKQTQAVKELAEKTPGMKNLLPYLAADEVNKIKKVNAKRMVDAFTSFPVEAEEMAAVAFSGEAKRGWYRKSAEALVEVFGAVDAPRFAALMAALSPQTGVEDNAINALNTWVNWTKAGRPIERDAIIKIMGESVQGGKGVESILPAWINNSVTALSTHEPEAIVLSGPKVDSFAYNLRGHVNAVTNDTWMANYFGIEQKQFARKNPMPGKTPGKGPMYIATVAMTRKAAEILTEKTGDRWTPDQIQETIWSWAKTLYEHASADKSTVTQLLKAGSVTPKDIADTPDFAILFTQNVYRKILEVGGYGEQAARIAASGGELDVRAGGRGSLLAAEGSGFTQSAFERHLYRAAERLDRVRIERAQRKAAKAEEDGLDDRYDPNEPRDPKGSETGGRWTSSGASAGKGYSSSARVIDGVIHTNNVYDAQRALFENRKVELKQIKQVATLIQRLGETAAEMLEQGDKAPVFNLCNVSIEGTNLFCAESKGIPRVKMPVIRAKKTKEFVAYLKGRGYSMEKSIERADHLRSTQDEIDGAKVAANMTRIDKEGFYKRIIVSRDGYILDGHHTWAGQLGVDARDGSLKNDKHVRITRVDISITKLLAEAETWTGGKGKKAAGQDAIDYDPEQPRDPAGTSTGGQWTSGGGGGERTTQGYAGAEAGAGAGGGGGGGARSADEAQRSAAKAAGGHTPLTGLPQKPLKVGGSYYVPGPLGKAREAADAYMKSAGLTYDRPKTYAKLDKERAARVAVEFEKMQHNPDDPAVKASYEALAKETLAQWQEIKKTGLKVEWIKPGQADPYAETPRLSAVDVIENNHWWGFPTDQGFGSDTPAAAAAIHNNPMLQPTDEVVDGRKLVVNDVFRIVHDYFGHFKEGNGFRAEGEENAWRSHSAMYSELARGAMTAETRGQNSWVNYGPFGEANRKASAGDTHYAPQKVGLMPKWASDEGRGDELPFALPGDDKLLLITHEPSHEQYDKWEIQIQERQNEIEKAEQIGSDEDDNLHRMKTALKEYRAASLETKDANKIGLSVVYGGPHDADETKLLAVTLVRFNPQEKVARITLSGGIDRDAHEKSLRMVIASYGDKATRIEGGAFGSDIETVLRYENAGFKMAGETSTGLVRLIHGNPELTEQEKVAKAEAAAKLEAVRKNEISARARVAAAALDFNPDYVRISDEDRHFKLNGQDYTYAGSYTRGDNAVVIYPKHASVVFAASATAHEIGHRKFDALRATYRDQRDDVMKEPGPPPDPNGEYWWQRHGGKDAVMKPDGTLNAPYDKKYPIYQAWSRDVELNYDDMRDEDGVSDYSKQYWEGYTHGNVDISNAMHETIAELSRLKFETGKLQGSKNWNKLFKLMDDHWAGMTKTERELKQPSSEKAYW